MTGNGQPGPQATLVLRIGPVPDTLEALRAAILVAVEVGQRSGLPIRMTVDRDP